MSLALAPLDVSVEVEANLPCRKFDPDLWFSDSPAELELAKSLCGDCPLRVECLAGAVERAEPWGVWGGEIFERGAVVAAQAAPRPSAQGGPRPRRPAPGRGRGATAWPVGCPSRATRSDWRPDTPRSVRPRRRSTGRENSSNIDDAPAEWNRDATTSRSAVPRLECRRPQAGRTASEHLSAPDSARSPSAMNEPEPHRLATWASSRSLPVRRGRWPVGRRPRGRAAQLTGAKPGSQRSSDRPVRGRRLELAEHPDRAQRHPVDQQVGRRQVELPAQLDAGLTAGRRCAPPGRAARPG